MQIVVTELPIEDALTRARQRFQQADQRLAESLAGGTSGLPWIALGVLVVVGGTLGLTGLFPLPGKFAIVMGGLLALGGACLGYRLPLWSRGRAERKRRTREWRHALEMLRLRERQAEEDPALTVEVLDRVDRPHPMMTAKWKAHTSATPKYVQ